MKQLSKECMDLIRVHSKYEDDVLTNVSVNGMFTALTTSSIYRAAGLIEATLLTDEGDFGNKMYERFKDMTLKKRIDTLTDEEIEKEARDFYFRKTGEVIADNSRPDMVIGYVAARKMGSGWSDEDMIDFHNFIFRHENKYLKMGEYLQQFKNQSPPKTEV